MKRTFNLLVLASLLVMSLGVSIQPALADDGTPPLNGQNGGNGFQGHAPTLNPPITIGGGWSCTAASPPEFTFGGVGSFNGEGAFTFTSAFTTVLRVTDSLAAGDQFRVYDFGVPIGDTSVPTLTGSYCDPDANYLDPNYSHGTFVLAPGSHSITIQALASPYSSGSGYLRVDSAATFVSNGGQDGHVTERNETAGFGGSSSASGGYLQIGDANADRQIKGVLSFDTSALPDGAVVVYSHIELRLIGFAGTNPFLTHGTLMVDIAEPSFDALTLAPGDFQATPSAYDVASCETALAAGWFSCDLFSGFGDVNLTGFTQFRLYFAAGDNDDSGRDYIKVASGNNPNATYRPVLVVGYYVP